MRINNTGNLRSKNNKKKMKTKTYNNKKKINKLQNLKIFSMLYTALQCLISALLA